MKRTLEDTISMFNTTMLKQLRKEDAEKIYEVAKLLANMVEPKKSYTQLYNSPEGRMERIRLSKIKN